MNTGSAEQTGLPEPLGKGFFLLFIIQAKSFPSKLRQAYMLLIS